RAQCRGLHPEVLACLARRLPSTPPARVLRQDPGCESDASRSGALRTVFICLYSKAGGAVILAAHAGQRPTLQSKKNSTCMFRADLLLRGSFVVTRGCDALR